MLINRFLPNPVGPDKAGEWIEILNNSSEVVNLIGWQIKDLSGKSYIFSAGGGPAFSGKNNELKAGETLQLPYVTTKITLNNNGETLFLYDPTGKLVNKLNFSGIAEEGGLISRETVNNIAASTTINHKDALLDSLFVNNFVFINITAALILSSVFFWIIKQIYADYFEPIQAGN